MIANMLWRIGGLLDFHQQLAWTREAGFDGVGFHASAGVPGVWCGVEPSTCNATERARLREELEPFSFTEIHAPFAILLQSGTLSSSLDALRPVLELARDLAVGLVTVHARPPAACADPGPDHWLPRMQGLDAAADRTRTRIALEIASGFDTVIGWGLPNVGVNLDVGHMYLQDNREALALAGGIGSLIRHIGPSLVHLHLHDVRGETDHIEIGTGVVPFGEIASALHDIGYPHGATLEMNPDRVSPEGIRRGAEYLSQCFLRAAVP